MGFIDPVNLDDFLRYKVQKVITDTYYRESCDINQGVNKQTHQPGEPRQIVEVQKLIYAVVYRTESWKTIEEFNILIDEDFVELMKSKQTNSTALHIGMFNDSVHRYLDPQNVCKKPNKEVLYIQRKHLLR